MNTYWRPTDSLLRSALGSVTIGLAAVVAGRPDALVLAVPLLVATLAALRRRPSLVPRAHGRLLHRSVREGEGTVLRTELHDAAEVEHAVVRAAPHRWLAWRPPGGVVAVTAADPEHRLTLDVPVAGLRWGRSVAGDGLVAATSAWAGFRWGPEPMPGQTLTTLPMPGRFDAHAPTPHPVGLVGNHPARRPGSGTELAGIRPFLPGDRLRRVHWPVSLRTGRLHATSTIAEEDSSLLLVVDAGVDIGRSGGVDGPASSLDTGVRAAGAVAEHYLRRGDRVGLRVLGSTPRAWAGMGSGHRQLRRILDTLAQIVPGRRNPGKVFGLHFGVSGGTVVVVLSPMLSEQAVAATVELVRHGLSVVVVDTLPDDVQLAEPDRRVRLAWRIRLLEREILLQQVRQAGVPVVPWRGPGSLDEVLRRLARRPPRPRAGRR